MAYEESKREENQTILVLVIAIAAIMSIAPVYVIYNADIVQKYEEYLKFYLLYIFFATLVSFFAVKYSFSHLTKKETAEKYRIIEAVNILKKQKEDIIEEKKVLEESMKVKEEALEKEKRYFENNSLMEEETGLYNRTYFYKILSDEINRAKRDKKQLMLAYLEIDNFEEYSKSRGAKEAENTIDIIGKEITRCAKRSADFSFKVDKFKFAIILSGLSLENTKRFINFIKESIDSSKTVQDEDESAIELSVSIGFAISFSEALPAAEDFEEKAQKALKKAKKSIDEKVIYEVIE